MEHTRLSFRSAVAMTPEDLLDAQAASLVELTARVAKLEHREALLIAKLLKLQDELILREGGWAKPKYREESDV